MDADAWDARYAEGRVWSEGPNRFFADAIGDLGATPGRALDLACGEGRNAVWLAQQGWDVTAVDFSAAGIDRGRAGAASLGAEVEWVVADLRTWEMGDERWDLVAHVYLHWETALREPFLARAAAAVAPGGALVIVGHDRTNIDDGHGGPQDPEVLTTPEEQRSLLEDAGLEVLRAEVVLRPVELEGGHGTPGDATSVDARDHVVIATRPR